MPLPFISAGPTSLVVFMSAVGVVLNISKQSKSYSALIFLIKNDTEWKKVCYNKNMDDRVKRKIVKNDYNAIAYDY